MERTQKIKRSARASWRMKKRSVIVFLILISVSWTCCKKKNEYKNLECSSLDASYANVIRPIIDANCTSSGCHNTGSSNGNYTTYEGLLVRVNNGTLSKRVLYTKDMPKNATLSLDDRKKIKCWIDAGAPKN